MRHLLIVGLPALSACERASQPLTQAEAREAFAETASSARAEASTAEVIEVSTSFTLGQAAQDAAEELRAWWQSQAPCAIVTRDDSTVTVDFGDLSDDCTYNDHTYAGVARITVVRADDGDVLVSHVWEGLTNGIVTVDGGADVTWSGGEDPSRHVVHDLVWSDAERSGESSGDRTQTLIDPAAGISGGVEINGQRAWTGQKGTWDLGIDGVQVRGQDPIPQAGLYTLTTPADKVMTMAFERVDDDTIEMTVSGLRGGDKVWLVTAEGEVVSEG